jgi:hypothetical protein
MKRNTVLSILTVLVLAGVITYIAASHLSLVARAAMAEEQTEIFEYMVTRTAEAVSQSPPDVRAAVGHLRYAHQYYPSGTKQVAGTRLDKIVERCRWLAEMRIIDMLRKATSEDHGADAEAWIKAFDRDAAGQGRTK